MGFGILWFQGLEAVVGPKAQGSKSFSFLDWEFTIPNSKES